MGKDAAVDRALDALISHYPGRSDEAPVLSVVH